MVNTDLQEWNDKYNPFNSTKVLVWREWLEGCANSNFLPPVTVDIDPSSRCNFDCIWCNFSDYNKQTCCDIPKSHLLKIADFITSWGVKSAHVLGGGEPLMNTGVNALFKRLKNNSVQSSLITNGVLLNDEIIETVAKSCRWVGISIDAGTRETYEKVKNTTNHVFFNTVIRNFEELCTTVKRFKSECLVCFKFLLHPLNASEIFEAAKLAKSLGATHFQVRPAGWENVDNKNIKKFDFAGVLETINNQIAQALLLETSDFSVYGIRHKFSLIMNRKINYSKCYASPIVLIFGADGNCHVCGDRRGQKEFILCSHYPNVEDVLRFWNSEKHKKIIQSVRLEECPRCVLGPYHEIIEKVFIEDRMCRYFP